MDRNHDVHWTLSSLAGHPTVATCPPEVSKSAALAAGVSMACAVACGIALAPANAQGTADHQPDRISGSAHGKAEPLANAKAIQIELSDIAAGEGGFVINGECKSDRSGRSVASAGDVNGDGLADLIVGALSADAGDFAGRSYVVFGKTGTTAIDLSAITAGSGGFVIWGQCVDDWSGNSVASAGDVNGDGLSDLIVGAPAGRTFIDRSAGHSYVVFGKTGTTPIDLAAIAAGIGGFVVNGECAGDSSGSSVGSAGDVNGDGLADLIVGAKFSAGTGTHHAGRSYVVFGKIGTAAIDLSGVAAGSGGFVINGECKYDHSGESVASAGDVNGDGLADLIVGASSDIGVDFKRSAGHSYVVFGKTATTPVDLSAIAAGGGGGFVINGEKPEDASGRSVASAGDVNGDGLADLIVGAPGAPSHADLFAGRSYVVFGKTGTIAVNLSTIAAGTGGFVINGRCADDHSGTSVASAGDVNGDGLADLFIGADGGDPVAGPYAGRSYVVFGKTGTTAIDLPTIEAGEGGFVINGQCAYDWSGSSVASAADVNGDGLADLIVGADTSDPDAGDLAGRSYVIFGSTKGAFRKSVVDQKGGAGNNALTGTSAADVLVGGAGDDTLTGKGGPDVLYGGSGDDLFVLRGSNVKALNAGFDATASRLARVDGGSGVDTLKLSGAHITLDLDKIADQGGSTPSSTSRIESVERIDLTGGGDNTLKLGVTDVQDMAGMNLINSRTQAALGWSNGTYSFAATVRRHQLIVDGNAGDVLMLGKTQGEWVNAGTVFNNDIGYTVYESLAARPRFGRVQVIVANEVTSVVVPERGNDAGQVERR